MVHKALIFVHLVGFAAYVGARFAQQRLLARSSRPDLAPVLRDDGERLAAALIVKAELPALLAQIATGVTLVVLTPQWLTQGWIHAKLTCVVVLLVLSHLEMFNARKIVKVRAARGDAAADEITARKRRHTTFGAIGGAVVAVLVALVAYGTA